MVIENLKNKLECVVSLNVVKYNRKKLIGMVTSIIPLYLILFVTVSLNAGWDVSQYKAIPNDDLDDTEAIQAVLDSAGAEGGGEVYLPAGHYVIDGFLQVPSGVVLKGVWQAPHHSTGLKGTVLLATGFKGQESGPPLIQLGENATLSGVTIFYPDQEFPDVSPYPWAVSGKGYNPSVINVTLVNAYQGIDFGTQKNQLHYIRNVFGTVLRRGIYVNQTYDIGRIENVHFNPHFWSRSGIEDSYNLPGNRELIDYLNQNTEVFIFGRTDWEYVLNTFAYGFDKCYKFIETEEGACNGNFLGIGADGGMYCVWIEETQPAGLLITNGEFVSFNGIEVITKESSDGVTQFSNCSFWGPARRVALLEGNGSVSFDQCNFVAWGITSTEKGSWERDPNIHAIRAESGTIRITNSKFNQSSAHIYLGSKVRSAVIMGNQFSGKMNLSDESPGDVQVDFNVSE